MTTHELIRGLTADRHVEAKPRILLLAALVAAIAFAAVVFFTRIGIREDIDNALHTIQFPFKFTVILPLAVVSVGALLRTATPVVALGWWARLLPLPPILLCAGVVAELLATPPSDWLAHLVGSNAVNCMTLIPLLASGPLAAFLVAMKAGAPAHPGFGGAAAGLAAGAIASVFYGMNCFDDSPLFVVTWYPLSIGGVACAGYVVGQRWLRW